MNDKDLFDLIFSYSDLNSILKENPEISRNDIDELKNKIKNYLKEERVVYKCLHLYTDGASRGNPGESGIGIVIKDDRNNVLREDCEYIGINTNNAAEYKALILGLKKAKIMNPSRLIIYSDSELLVNQINGIYRVKSTKLIELYWDAVNLLKSFTAWDFKSIRREQNKKADMLANLGIDKKENRSGVS